MEIIRFVWKAESIPDEWNIAIICPIFKKRKSNRNKTLQRNSHICKLYNLKNGSIRKNKFKCKRYYSKLSMWFQTG